jgi:hypothetical protein
MVTDGTLDEDTRRYPRIVAPGNVRATIRDADGHEHEVGVADISAGGAGLVVDGAFGNSDFVNLHMEGVGDIPARVARRFAEGIGIEFQISEKEREAMKDELLAFRKAAAGKF